MYKLKLTSVSKEYSIPDEVYYLKAAFDLFDSEGEVVESRSIGLPLKSSQEEIEEELQKYIDNLNSEKEMAVANAEADKIDADIVAIDEELKGKEYSPREKKEQVKEKGEKPVKE